jgi:dolichol-phosphate mannosyltransferase
VALDSLKLKAGGASMAALVVVPTYNELHNLGPLVEQVLAQGDEFHVLVIDDGSPDGTGLLADHLAAENPDRVEVIHRQGKLGLATAYLAGFRYGVVKGYDYIFQMDADFSHDPRYLPQFMAVARATGADVVLGSRYVEGGGVVDWPWYRRLISRGGSAYAGVLLDMPFRDLTGGFKLFRRAALEGLDLSRILSTGYGFQIEVTYRLHQQGAHIVEMPIVFAERRQGQSKMSSGIFLEALMMVVSLRFSRPWEREGVPTRERARL